MCKSRFLLAFVCLASFCSANAQSYEVGTNVVSAGIGIGSSIAGYTYGSQSPAFSATYERGLWNAGPGVVSLGAYVGFKDYKYSSPYAAEKWNYTIVGIRGAYHYTGLNIDNLDLYGGFMLSYNHVSYKYADLTDGLGGGESPSYGSDLFLTPFVGARYYFFPGLSAFAELGYGVSTLNLGLAVKF